MTREEPAARHDHEPEHRAHHQEQQADQQDGDQASGAAQQGDHAAGDVSRRRGRASCGRGRPRRGPGPPAPRTRPAGRSAGGHRPPARPRRGRRSPCVARAPAGRRPRSRPGSRSGRGGRAGALGGQRAGPGLPARHRLAERRGRLEGHGDPARQQVQAVRAVHRPEAREAPQPLVLDHEEQHSREEGAGRPQEQERDEVGVRAPAHLLEGRAQDRLARGLAGVERLRRGGPRGGAGAATLEPRQQVPRQLVAERAQVGLVLERVQLRQAGLEGEERDAEPLRPRAQLLVERLGHEEDGRGAGQAAGEARDVEPSAEGRARLGGEPEIGDQQEWRARRGEPLHLPPRHAGARGQRDGVAGRGQALAHDPADVGLVVQQENDGPGRGRGRGRLLEGQLLEHHVVLHGRGEGGLEGGGGVAVVLVQLAGEVEHELFRVDAVGERLAREVPPAERRGNAVRQVEGEVALSQPDEPLEDRRQALPQDELARGALRGLVAGQSRHVPHVARDDPPALEEDRGLAGRGAHGEKAGLLAEGDDLQDLEKRKVLDGPAEAHAFFIARSAASRKRARGAGLAMTSSAPRRRASSRTPSPAAPVKRTTAECGRRRRARLRIS